MVERGGRRREVQDLDMFKLASVMVVDSMASILRKADSALFFVLSRLQQGIAHRQLHFITTHAHSLGLSHLIEVDSNPDHSEPLSI
jgi:hypothetical protein